MAPSSRIPASSRGFKEIEMEMTPMIDVTFLLLIFFMCTLKFKTLEGRLHAFLPKDEGLNHLSQETPEPLDVGIHLRAKGTKLNGDGTLWSPGQDRRWEFGADRRLEYSVGPQKGLDLSQLRALLNELDPSASPEGIVLFAGAGCVQKEAVEVLDLLMSAGHSQVRIHGAVD